MHDVNTPGIPAIKSLHLDGVSPSTVDSPQYGIDLGGIIDSGTGPFALVDLYETITDLEYHRLWNFMLTHYFVLDISTSVELLTAKKNCVCSSCRQQNRSSLASEKHGTSHYCENDDRQRCQATGRGLRHLGCHQQIDWLYHVSKLRVYISERKLECVVASR